MMYLMGIALVTLLLYAALTVLPVVRLDCPYRTPLSATLWSLLQCVVGILRHRFLVKADDHRSRGRLGSSGYTDSRPTCIRMDTRVLTDDVELLPFVEAIPDMIDGSNGFRRIKDPLFESFFFHDSSDAQLVIMECEQKMGLYPLPKTDKDAAKSSFGRCVNRLFPCSCL
jgi:hypothetical protein